MMKQTATPSKSQTVALARGAQVVINGAIVTASEPCTLEVGSGAFVLTGRSLWRGQNSDRKASEELYFSILDAGVDEMRFAKERFRLFMLLSRVVAQERSHKMQKECSLCAAAMIAGNIEDATRSAARLASDGMSEVGKDREKPLPGQTGERRSQALSRSESELERPIADPLGQ